MEEYKQLKDTLKKIPSFQDREKVEGGNEQPEARGPSPQSHPPEQHGAGAEQQQEVKGFRHPSDTPGMALGQQNVLSVSQECVFDRALLSVLEESSEEWFNC